MAQTRKQNKKKQRQIVVKIANVYIKATFNNTIITATDEAGNVFAWASTGMAGFKGSKKSTPYASSQTARILIDKMREVGVEEANIFVSGVSSGRDSAIRAFGTAGFRIGKLKDVTPIPHNGCRAKKPRRV
jgi:small subunit ribosomal protein S11